MRPSPGPTAQARFLNTLINRDNAASITTNIAANPPAFPAIIAFSGRGANAAALKEPAHVSVILYQGPTAAGGVGSWRLTQLNDGAGHRANIEIGAVNNGGLPGQDGLFRVWQVTAAQLAAATAEATRLAGLSAAGTLNRDYRRIGGAWRSFSSYNCAYYAEKIIRASGLNVSAGRIWSSPLELTTGRSRPMRELYSWWDRKRGRAGNWFENHPR